MFVGRQLRASLFALIFFAALVISRYLTFGLPRYDFLLIVALLAQCILILSKYESMSEVRAIAFFHVLGLTMEIFKTHPLVGSWSYPEFGYMKFFGVPLYAGFMYAAVGSYMMRAWKELRITLIAPPSRSLAVMLSALVYINFFSHHYIIDMRYPLMGMLLMLFRRTKIEFTVGWNACTVPFAYSFIAFGVVIWLAENIATYFGAWQYPHQSSGWRLVHFEKVLSWALLATISFIIVASRDKRWNRS